jgi:hypothetical protein
MKEVHVVKQLKGSLKSLDCGNPLVYAKNGLGFASSAPDACKKRFKVVDSGALRPRREDPEAVCLCRPFPKGSADALVFRIGLQ